MVKLTAISSRAWEHPADRAALQALRSLPGFDEAVRRAMGFLGERGVRQLFLGNAVRVGPQQRPKLDALYSEVLETLDAPERWELYAADVGWDPRSEGPPYVAYLLTPVQVQAWRESNELADRTLMRDGTWLSADRA